MIYASGRGYLEKMSPYSAIPRMPTALIPSQGYGDYLHVWLDLMQNKMPKQPLHLPIKCSPKLKRKDLLPHISLKPTLSLWYMPCGPEGSGSIRTVSNQHRLSYGRNGT